jgi:hypothetical protein
MKNLHPARLYSLAEALLAAACAFVPGLTGAQVATILGIVAVMTGEQVRRKVAE